MLKTISQDELKAAIASHKLWLNGDSNGQRLVLVGYDLSHSNLRHSDLSHSNLRHSNLSNSNLSNSDLSYSDLSYSDLSYSDLSNSNLSNSNLSNSNLSNSDLSYSDLRHSNLSNSDLRHSDLSNSDLRHSNLWDTVGNKRNIITIQTGVYIAIYTDTVLQIGCQQHIIEDWWQFDDDKIESMDSKALEFWRVWKPLLQAIIAANPAKPTGFDKAE